MPGMNVITPTGTPHTELTILDVDGVVFRGQFIAQLARRMSSVTCLLTLADAFLYETSRIPLEEFLRRAYGRLKGMSWSEVEAVYRDMTLHAGAAETVARLRAAGQRVVLVTAGVPDPIVKQLARRLGADDGVGIEAPIHNGHLTGEVAGELITADGKPAAVSRLMKQYGLSWSRVAVVGDDRNNLEIIRRAEVGIGFRATSSIRHDAPYLVDSHDLRDILRFLLPGHEARAPLSRRGQWHREIKRKMLHITGALMPLFFTRHPIGTVLMLVCAMGVYFLAELCRIYGMAAPVASRISSLVIREDEERGLAYGPATLALGVLCSLALFDRELAFACVLIAAISDSLAAVVGRRWGRIPWFYNRSKSMEGSAAFLIGALACGLLYLPLSEAVVLAAVATWLESLPVRDWDNFITPVGAGMVTRMLLLV